MEFKKHAFILAIIESLQKHGSWTGKTHIQKALSLLRDLGLVKVPFDFVLYKHGPYSFDVETELEEMKSYGAITIEPSVAGYGTMVFPGEMSGFVKGIAESSKEEVIAIENVCAFVGSRKVTELERLATASWIRHQEHVTKQADVAKRLNSLKPHISIVDAERADDEITTWLSLNK